MGRGTHPPCSSRDYCTLFVGSRNHFPFQKLNLDNVHCSVLNPVQFWSASPLKTAKSSRLSLSGFEKNSTENREIL